jgi:succinate dehydrogenase flavin-adding protein (antitoxin of CptAB toxin-antitoxin module)
MAVAVSECTIEGSEPPQKTPPGILMSQEMTMRAARLKVAYDEMRGLYEVDLRTMDREREIYERHLKAADDEIADWKQKARRSWWELNQGTVGLVVGVVTGAALTIGIAAAIDQATE